jgi:23S rRNA (adenine2503-C2)-methyltransferase
MDTDLPGEAHGHKRERARDPGAAAGTARADLAGLTSAEFIAWGRELVGHHDRFHRAAYAALMAGGTWDPGSLPQWREAGRTVPGLISRLAAAAVAAQCPVVSGEAQASDPVLGRTRKILARLADGQQVESVLIPMGGGDEAGGHSTVCVSSQVGCRMGCTFCHTARMGLVRNLSAAEIVGQVLTIAAHTGQRPRNVVFMGMGEPLDNLDAVAQAVRVLTDRCGLRLAHRHITISTVGRVDGLARLPALGLDRVNLAVSLTAADDGLRSRLMPVNRTYDLARLKAALAAIPLARGRRILISYVLMEGVNDGDEAIQALIAWCAGLRVLVNLIPYNPIPGREEHPTRAARIATIRALLMAAGVPVRMRLTKGDGVMAACGQLGDPGRRRMKGA